MKNFTRSLCIMGLLPLLFASCHTANEQKVLRVAHGLSSDHSVHKAMIYLGEVLTQKSGGQLTVKIYPSAQLGAERETVELLQLGSVAITKVSAAVMESFAEEYQVLGLPYLFRAKAHAFRVFDGEVGRDILLSGEEVWLRGLGFYDAGSRSFYAKEKPITTPSDLAGMKVRVMKSNTAINMVRAMGGTPTPIPFGEIYTALQSGVVDAAENNPPSLYLSGHYEVCKYYSIDEHTQVPDVLLIGKPVWDALTEQERAWVQEAADASVVRQHELWRESEEEAMNALKAAGVQINYPEKDPFAADVQGIYADYRAQPQLDELIRRIQALE
ncbi:MAG: TRAP transporter substrate-binding protein [Tunicatimonas sp.]